MKIRCTENLKKWIHKIFQIYGITDNLVSMESWKLGIVQSCVPRRCYIHVECTHKQLTYNNLQR